jgi:hypothetical protein
VGKPDCEYFPSGAGWNYEEIARESRSPRPSGGGVCPLGAPMERGQRTDEPVAERPDPEVDATRQPAPEPPEAHPRVPDYRSPLQTPTKR